MNGLFSQFQERESWTDWNDLIDYWFSDQNINPRGEKFAVIFPNGHISFGRNESRWKKIQLSWNQINNSLPGKQLHAWRVIHSFGEEIAPNLGVFRLRNQNNLCLFWLSPNNDNGETRARFADILPKISAYYHIMQGRGLFHAAGILYKGSAYLFIGQSGVGKTTISQLSSKEGKVILHDDHVVISKGESGKWLVSDLSNSFHDIPIKALFFLAQDKEDQLQDIKTPRSVMHLINSLREHGDQILYEDVFRRAFKLCADIARSLPSYELHFRRSADFWKLIDEQFPD